MKKLMMVLLLSGCIPFSVPTATVPIISQLDITVQGNKEQVIATMNGAAVAMGFTVREANPAGGVWGTTFVHAHGNTFSEALVGADGELIEINAILNTIHTDSVHIVIMGTWAFYRTTNQFATDANAITSTNKYFWPYLVSFRTQIINDSIK